jgi:hypothetical protein
MKLTKHCNHRSGHLKTEHTVSLLLLRRHLGNWSRGLAVSMRRELLLAHEKLGQFPLWQCMLCPCRLGNTFCNNSWNCTILLCLPCIHNILVSWSGVRLIPLGTLTTSWAIVPAQNDDHECGAIGGMFSRGTRSTLRKPVSLPLFFHYKSHMTWSWARTRASAVGSQRLTALAIALPKVQYSINPVFSC